jgi:hypothetical protein
MLSSGMGRAEIRHLTVEDFLFSHKVDNIDTIQSKDDLIGNWWIPRYKTTNLYYTFNTLESTKAIITYLQNERENIKADEPLFASNFEGKIMSNGAFEGLFQLKQLKQLKNLKNRQLLKKLLKHLLNQKREDKV